jgi:HEPN domain-containing protein
MTGPHELARILLDKAKGDHYVLARLLPEEEAPAWTLGFHAQQAVEKSLKTVLCTKAVEYPHTHNLAMLLELLRRNRLPLPPDAEDLPRLTTFGAAFRYEDELEGESAPVLDREWAAGCVARTIRWAETTLDRETRP